MSTTQPTTDADCEAAITLLLQGWSPGPAALELLESESPCKRLELLQMMKGAAEKPGPLVADDLARLRRIHLKH